MGDYETEDEKKARIRQRVKQRRRTKQLDRSAHAGEAEHHHVAAALSDGPRSRAGSPEARDSAAQHVQPPVGHANHSAIPFVDDVGTDPHRVDKGHHYGGFYDGRNETNLTANGAGESGFVQQQQQQPFQQQQQQPFQQQQQQQQLLLMNEILKSVQQMTAVASTAAEAAKEAASAAASVSSATERAGPTLASRADGGGGMDDAAKQENARLQKQVAELQAEVAHLSELKQKNELLDDEMDRFSREFSQLASRKQELEIRNQQLEAQLEKNAVDSESILSVKTDLASAQVNLQQVTREKTAAEQQRDMFASEIEALKVEMTETERDLEESIEKEAMLEKANSKMKTQIGQAAQLIHENEALKDDQALLTQELKRMQVEMQQLKDKVGNGVNEANVARERDDWRRRYEELSDKQSMQLAEFATKEAEREQQYQELLRAKMELEQSGSGLQGEVTELRARNEELLQHVTELEVDLQNSDADLEKAINQLESHGIAFE